ncbi:hypothetical protein J4E05_16665 [Thalassospira sp. NFXS8]|uniref:hypothetical protein n=1 Tax=Thalassospira sp. NFXS8 TaxID=2819093 RepID=UPI0032DFE086
MNINQLIFNFRGFLISSWSNVMEILEHLDWDNSPYFLDDWMQANWEFFVEKRALESEQFLVPYGGNSSSECRYTDKGRVLTHRVTCKKKGESKSQYYFFKFVTKDDGCIRIWSPFDYIYVEDIKTGDRFYLAFDEVEFSVDQIV